MARPLPPKEHQFKPGQSGNPKGRPRKIPDLDTLLADVLGEEKNGVTAAEAILKKLRSIAATGSSAHAIRAAEVLLDRAYGKSHQRSTSRVEMLNLDQLNAEARELAERLGLIDLP